MNKDIRIALRTSVGIAKALHDALTQKLAILEYQTVARDNYKAAVLAAAAAYDTVVKLRDPYLLRIEGNEPLDETEETVYDALNNHLRLPEDQFEELTHAQKFSAARVIRKQGYAVQRAIVTDHLGITFRHIYIGIEPDGYAHS